MWSWGQACRVVVLVVLVVAMGPAFAGDLEPGAAPAPTMKTLVEIEPRVAVQTLPSSADALHVISEPGSYYLTGDITGESGKSGIYIATSHVTLDLRGYALVGVTGSEHGVETALDLVDIEVRNGIARDWGSHGFVVHARGGALLELRAFDNGVMGLNIWEGLIDGCVARGNGGAGIRLDGNGVVRNCASSNNGESGFKIVGSGLLEASTAGSNSAYGVELVFDGHVRGCHIDGNGVGVLAQMHARIVDNNLSENGVGIEIRATGEACLVSGNSLLGGDVGVRVNDGASGNLIVRNSAGGTNVVAFDIGPGNAFGPVIDVAGAGDISVVSGSEHPWANFLF